MLSIVALIMAIVYSVKSRKETDNKKKANYKKGANVWGVVFLSVIALEVLFRALQSSGAL
jgi:heme exporter protein D